MGCLPYRMTNQSDFSWSIFIVSSQVFLRRTVTLQHIAARASQESLHRVARHQPQEGPMPLLAVGQWWTLLWTTHRTRKGEGELGIARTRKTARTAQHPKGVDTIMTKTWSLHTETGWRYGLRGAGGGLVLSCGISEKSPFSPFFPLIKHVPHPTQPPKIYMQTHEHMHKLKLLTSGADGHPHNTNGNSQMPTKAILSLFSSASEYYILPLNDYGGVTTTFITFFLSPQHIVCSPNHLASSSSQAVNLFEFLEMLKKMLL